MNFLLMVRKLNEKLNQKKNPLRLGDLNAKN